jgi:hypothetical protein
VTRQRLAWLAGAVLLAMVVGAGSAGASVGAAGTSRERPSRVLVLSLPGITWSDLQGAGVPTLSRLLGESAVADLVTRSDRQPSALGAAYVTIGAGTRSGSASATDGDALGTRERFGNATAGDAYHQRTGRDPGPGIVQLGIAQITAVNDALLFDGQVGALGDTLRDAGFSRAVIANADHAQPDSPTGGDPQFERSAVSALMGSRGLLRGGEVGPALLRNDRFAPYGVRLDPSAVAGAFQRAWKPHSVVLVEGSDLVRADRYSAYATSAQADQLRLQALRETDALAARLLAHVDPARDAVLVVAPTSRPGDRSLTVAALRAPGIEPGLLRTATTRRAGFVSLADIAPTILHTLGVSAPDSMEGRPMRVAASGGSFGERQAFLIRANEDGLMRDSLVTPVSNVVAWTAIALALGALILLGRVSWAGHALRWVALGLIGFMVATFAIVPLHISQHGGANAFWSFTILFAIAFAALCHWAGSKGPLDPLIAALGALVLVLTLDNFTGAHLELNSVFGYSATVGIRLAGNSNTAFALLGAAAVLLAGLLAWRIGAPRGPRIAIVLLAVVLIAFTPPLFGQDFGGTIAAAPAFLVLAWLLLGRRIRLRTCVAFAAVLVVSGLAVGFIDLMRPSDQRTHVGRFFEQVGNQGWSGFATVLQRKGSENASTLTRWLSILVVVVVVAAIMALWTRAPRRLRPVVDAVPTLRPVALALVVLAALGYALNDSGIVIPALMAAVVAAALAALVSSPLGADAIVEAGPKPLTDEMRASAAR